MVEAHLLGNYVQDSYQLILELEMVDMKGSDGSLSKQISSALKRQLENVLLTLLIIDILKFEHASKFEVPIDLLQIL